MGKKVEKMRSNHSAAAPQSHKTLGKKTPESPKIPLQLGCSVTQIRHFFKRTFFNLPLIFENNVKKATVWLHERAKPLRQCFALPPPLPRGGLGIPQSFASSPEAPLLGELAGASPTERLDEGRPDRIAFAGLNLSVTPAACHLPYRGEALAFRKALPLRQRLPY